MSFCKSQRFNSSTKACPSPADYNIRVENTRSITIHKTERYPRSYYDSLNMSYGSFSDGLTSTKKNLKKMGYVYSEEYFYDDYDSLVSQSELTELTKLMDFELNEVRKRFNKNDVQDDDEHEDTSLSWHLLPCDQSTEYIYDDYDSLTTEEEQRELEKLSEMEINAVRKHFDKSFANETTLDYELAEISKMFANTSLENEMEIIAVKKRFDENFVDEEKTLLDYELGEIRRMFANTSLADENVDQSSKQRNEVENIINRALNDLKKVFRCDEIIDDTEDRLHEAIRESFQLLRKGGGSFDNKWKTDLVRKVEEIIDDGSRSTLKSSRIEGAVENLGKLVLQEVDDCYTDS